MLYHYTAAGKHLVPPFSLIFIRVTNKLAVTAGLPELPGHEAVAESPSHIRAFAVGIEAGRQSRAEIGIVLGDRKPAVRPRGPFAGRVQPGEAAADIFAAEVASPIRVLELHTTELDFGLLLGMH